MVTQPGTGWAALAKRLSAVSLRDRLGLTLRKEPRVGPAVVTHRDGAMAEMNHLNGMREASRGARVG